MALARYLLSVVLIKYNPQCNNVIETCAYVFQKIKKQLLGYF